MKAGATIRLLAAFLLWFAFAVPAPADSAVKWMRHVIEFTDSTHAGNPFDVVMDVVFTDPATGRTIRLPAYYAGADTWKVGFMPDHEGEWRYVTESPDPDLDGIRGAVTAAGSDLPGILKADPDHPRKWKYTDDGYAVPIALRLEMFSEPGTDEEFRAVADFMQENNMQLIETRLLEETGQFGGRHDFIFAGAWQEHRFDLDVWDRIEARMDMLASRGLGAHIMFYSDDLGEPQWAGRSDTERLVIRYAVARLAGYPVVLFNTGLDLSEYRDQSWVDWFGEEIRKLDPYGHPVSSRYGGGSGRQVMAGQTFDSRGAPLARIGTMTEYFRNAAVPVSMDDAWGENRPERKRKNFRPEDIRRAFWKALLAGGLGGLVRGSDGYFHMADLPDDLESEQWLTLINPFIRDRLGDTFARMVPRPELVVNAYCISDPRMEKVLVYTPGVRDRWDAGNGKAITVRLRLQDRRYLAYWYDTRPGREIPAGMLDGWSDHVIEPPSKDDWALLLESVTEDGNDS